MSDLLTRFDRNIGAVLAVGVLVAFGAVLLYTSDSLDMEEWGLPLIIFCGALFGGLALASSIAGDEREAQRIQSAGQRLDLEARHQEALEALAALETQRDQMAPEDYAAERKALLAKGAEALRLLDQLDAATPAAPVPPPAPENAPVTQPDPIAEGIRSLTEALSKGEIDAATYAQAVAALNASRPTTGGSTSPSPEAPPPSAPVAAPPSAPGAAAPPSPAVPVSAPAEGASVVAPKWVGAIYAVVGMALVGALVYFVQTDATPRRDGAGMTGKQDLGMTASDPPSEPPFVAKARAEAEAALAANPKDIDALNKLTQLYFNTPQKAFNYNRQALEIDPNNPDARVNDAVITMTMGMADKALAKLDAVIAEHPEHDKAYAYKGLILLQLKRYEEAVAPLEKAKALGVNDHTIDNALAMAKSGGTLEPPPVPASGNPSVLVSGTVDLDPNRATFKATTLFVNIKDPARPGPPLAAVKLPPGPFPMTFQVTEADRIAMGPMANQPIPEQIQLSLRLDEDGNAFSKGPSDPQVVQKVTKGTQGLNLVLR